MIRAFLLLLPPAVCLFWMLLYPFLISRKNTFSSLMFLLFTTGLYLLADSCYASPLTTNMALTVNSLIAQISAPFIIPLLLIYRRKIGNNSSLKHIHLVWALIPIILFTGELIMVLMFGPENIENYLGDIHDYGVAVADANTGNMYRIYYIWAVILFRIVMAIEILLLLINLILLLKNLGLPLRFLSAFLYHKGNIRVLGLTDATVYFLMLIGLSKVLLPRSLLLAHPWIALTFSPILAFLLFIAFYIGLYSDRDTVSLADMKRGLINIPESKQDIAGKSSIKSIHAAAIGNNDPLVAKFHRVVIDQRMFLQPQVTITDVADRIGSNKTYISRLVNNTYNMPFPDLINYLRVEYTQRYIINHRNATQTEVAKACGFTSASALNNTFKKVTGVTPKIWLATHDRNQDS